MSGREAARRVMLCELSSLAADDAVALDLAEADLEVIVVMRGGKPYAYDNRCPHRGTSLDWSPGRLLSQDGAHLQCATHGALFEPRTGVCVRGPCAGAGLTPLRVVRDGAQLFLELP